MDLLPPCKVHMLMHRMSARNSSIYNGINIIVLMVQLLLVAYYICLRDRLHLLSSIAIYNWECSLMCALLNEGTYINDREEKWGMWVKFKQQPYAQLWFFQRCVFTRQGNTASAGFPSPLSCLATVHSPSLRQGREEVEGRVKGWSTIQINLGQDVSLPDYLPVLWDKLCCLSWSSFGDQDCFRLLFTVS